MAQVARGSLLKVSISSTLTTIAELRNPVSNNTRDTIETTHNGSGDDRSYAAGLMSGEYTAEINYDRTSTTHEYIEDSIQSGTTETFQVTQADGETDDFSGIITGFNKSFNYDDIQRAELTIQRTGASTLSTPA